MSDESVYCPLCGNKVSTYVSQCPFCSTKLERVLTRRELDKVIEKRLMQRLESSRTDDGSLTKDLFSAGLPEVKVSCPSCGQEMQPGTVRCSRCGVPIVTEDDMLECPECGTVIAQGAAECPKCGVPFEVDLPTLAEPLLDREVAGEPEPEEESPLPAGMITTVPAETAAPDRGFTNGRGAVNGTGLVNGTGMINGTGKTNGTGMINGTRGDKGPSSGRGRKYSTLTRWPFLAVLVAVLIIIPMFIYFAYSTQSGPFEVDGDFSEWSDVETFSVRVDAPSAPTIDVDRWAARSDSNDMYVYIRAKGSLMSTTVVDSFYVFIDSDGSASTGYTVGSLGADYLMELTGWNNSVQSTSVMVFDPDDDSRDWNSWARIGSLSYTLDGSELEAKAVLPMTVSSSAKSLLVSQDELERRAISYEAPSEGGLLIIEQESLIPSDGIVIGESDVSTLRLSVTCQGSEGTVDSVSFTSVGASSTSAVPAFSVAPGDAPHVVDVSVDVSAVPGGLVSLFVNPAASEWSFTHVEIVGDGACGYYNATPTSIAIDGAFADWDGIAISDTEGIPVSNPNIDIDEFAMAASSLHSFFYVSVDGEMCAGTYVPAIKGKSSGTGGGSPVAPVRKTGEDFVRVYIDADIDPATGYPVSISSKVIGAEYMVEVVGQYGELVSESLYAYDGSWTLVITSVEAAKDSQRIEIGVLASTLGGGSAIDFIIETTDWKERADVAASDEFLMSAVSGGLLSDTKSWVVDSSSNSRYATAHSCQRQLFYDGTNFWSFFYDGGDTVYKCSEDGGQTWTAMGDAFTTSGVNETSIWYDRDNNKIYIIGDNAVSSPNVTIRSGTVNPSTPEIVWGSEVKYAISTFMDMANKNTFICRDASGYLWIASTTHVSDNPSDKYNFKTAISQNPDDISSWFERGNVLAGSGVNSDPKGVMVPGKPGSGYVVWIVYTFDGEVESRTHDGSTWANAVEVYGGGGSTLNTVYAPPSAVIDSNGVVHVVYGTGDQSAGVWIGEIEYRYNQGAGWSSVYTLDDATTYVTRSPTVSIDTSTGNVYAMWLNSNNDILVEKNVSGSWSSITIPHTDYAKSYLTSVYNASDESLICFQWTQNTSLGNIEVIFDKIPEFTDTFIPVLFILTLFAVYRSRARRIGPGKDCGETGDDGL